LSPYWLRHPLLHWPDTAVAAAMSVLLETSAGDIVVDLLVDYAPALCEK
jgi:hypothetical protein